MAEQTTTHAPPRLRRACRQDRILAELHAQPALRASELSQMLEVSHETIRRDLIDLDRRGLLRRGLPFVVCCTVGCVCLDVHIFSWRLRSVYLIIWREMCCRGHIL